jgi:hypothetical protein
MSQSTSTSTSSFDCNLQNELSHVADPLTLQDRYRRHFFEWSPWRPRIAKLMAEFTLGLPLELNSWKTTTDHIRVRPNLTSGWRTPALFIGTSMAAAWWLRQARPDCFFFTSLYFFGHNLFSLQMCLRITNTLHRESSSKVMQQNIKVIGPITHKSHVTMPLQHYCSNSYF